MLLLVCVPLDVGNIRCCFHTFSPVPLPWAQRSLKTQTGETAAETSDRNILILHWFSTPVFKLATRKFTCYNPQTPVCALRSEKPNKNLSGQRNKKQPVSLHAKRGFASVFLSNGRNPHQVNTFKCLSDQASESRRKEQTKKKGQKNAIGALVPRKLICFSVSSICVSLSFVLHSAHKLVNEARSNRNKATRLIDLYCATGWQ